MVGGYDATILVLVGWLVGWLVARVMSLFTKAVDERICYAYSELLSIPLRFMVDEWVYGALGSPFDFELRAPHHILQARWC